MIQSIISQAWLLSILLPTIGYCFMMCETYVTKHNQLGNIVYPFVFLLVIGLVLGNIIAHNRGLVYGG